MNSSKAQNNRQSPKVAYESVKEADDINERTIEEERPSTNQENDTAGLAASAFYQNERRETTEGEEVKKSQDSQPLLIAMGKVKESQDGRSQEVLPDMR